MTKTPEELTNDWKAKKLETGSLWFVETDDGCRAEPMLVDIDGDLNDLEGKIYVPSLCGKHYLKILAPCNYDHFADLRKKAEKYDRIKVNGNYPDKISKLKSRIKKLLEEKDHFAELTEKIKTLSSENECLLNLQAVAKREIEELESDSLAKKEGEEIVAELTNENNNLRALLKECGSSVFKIYDRLRFSDEDGITPSDLINAIDEIKPMLLNLITKINEVLK